MPTTLGDIEELVDHLSVEDQVRLLAYLAPRIAGGVLSASPQAETDDAVARFRQVEARLARTSKPGAESLTAAVCETRR